MRASAIAAVGCVLLLSGPSGAAGDLLRNGGFEEGGRAPVGWTFAVFSTQPSRGTFDWSREAHSGEHAARLLGTENAGDEATRYLIYSDPIAVEEGLLRLKGWYRTGGAARAQIQIPLYTEDFAAKRFGTPVHDTIYRNLQPAAEWSPFEFEINATRPARQLVIMLRAADIGEVYYDDVSLEPVEDALSLKLYPAEYGREKTLPLVRGAPNFARIMLIGDRRRISETAEVVIDLPEGVGDFGLVGPGDAAVRDGTGYRRFRVPIPPDTLDRLKTTVSSCSLTLWIDADGAPETGNVYYHAVVDGQQQREKQATLKVLPALPEAAPPSRFGGFYCWGLFGDVPERLRPDVYGMLRGMGVTHHLAAEPAKGWRSYLQGRLHEDGGKLWANVPHELTKELRSKGWETRIIAEGKSFFELVDPYYRTMAPMVDGIFWDWEPANAMHNPLWDDAATVAAFAEREGLDAETLSEERLTGELRDRFLGFRTWQLGEVMRLWAEYIHDLRPDLTVAVCQGSGMPPDRHVDYRVYDDIPNLVHLPMIYTSSPLAFARNVEGLREYLPEARILPMTSSMMVADSGWLAAKTPRGIYFDFVASGLLGCEGCSHWPDLHRGLDMEYVWEITRAVHHIACVEGFLFEGQASPDRVSVEALPENEARITTGPGEVVITSPQWDKHALCFSYRLGGKTLAAVCNMHPEKAATVSVRIGDAQGDGWHLWDPVSRTALLTDKGAGWSGRDLGRGVLYEVPASSLGMLVAARTGPEGGPAARVRESDVRRRFERRRAEARAAGDIAVIREGDLEIGWEDMDGDGNAEVRVASPHQALGLGPSGNLWSWKVGDWDGDLVSRFDGGGACEDRFWWPEDARASDDGRSTYELVAREIKGGRASVAFRRELAHWSLGGLVLEKTYSVGDETPAFEVRVTVRNASPNAHEFSYWSHSCFRVRDLPALALATSEGQQVISGEQQPREIWAPVRGLPADQAGLLKAPEGPQLVQPSFALGDPGDPRIEVQTEPSLLQLYRWWDGTTRGRYTLEWMYRKQRLEAGRAWTTRYRVEFRS